MKREDILKKVAPCSLMCHTCSAYNNGAICETSKELLKYLSGMKEFYEKNIPETVDRYTNFLEVLQGYSSGPCAGCRSKEHNICSIQDCFLLDCTSEHNVDFCGECNEFPCNRTKSLFAIEVYEQWLNGSQQIKEIGIEAFWNNNSETHYAVYIK